ADLLQEYQVAPELLTLEVTEAGAMGEPDRPLPILRRLSELGVRLAVDDVGPGYSSLSFLRQLPVQELKIDKSFIQGMATDAGDLAIVRTVVDLSRHFGLVAVAEGVESELTLGLLADMGCDIGQGFLFSRPLPYERLEAWMAAQTDAEPSPAGQVRRLRVVSGARRTRPHRRYRPASQPPARRPPRDLPDTGWVWLHRAGASVYASRGTPWSELPAPVG